VICSDDRLVRIAAVCGADMLRIEPMAVLTCCACEINDTAERQVWAGTDARAATKSDNCCAALVGGSEPLADMDDRHTKVSFVPKFGFQAFRFTLQDGSYSHSELDGMSFMG
jgi:hypothetical protein